MSFGRLHNRLKAAGRSASSTSILGWCILALAATAPTPAEAIAARKFQWMTESCNELSREPCHDLFTIEGPSRAEQCLTYSGNEECSITLECTIAIDSDEICATADNKIVLDLSGVQGWSLPDDNRVITMQNVEAAWSDCRGWTVATVADPCTPDQIIGGKKFAEEVAPFRASGESTAGSGKRRSAGGDHSSRRSSVAGASHTSGRSISDGSSSGEAPTTPPAEEAGEEGSAEPADGRGLGRGSLRVQEAVVRRLRDEATSSEESTEGGGDNATLVTQYPIDIVNGRWTVPRQIDISAVEGLAILPPSHSPSCSIYVGPLSLAQFGAIYTRSNVGYFPEDSRAHNRWKVGEMALAIIALSAAAIV